MDRTEGRRRLEFSRYRGMHHGPPENVESTRCKIVETFGGPTQCQTAPCVLGESDHGGDKVCFCEVSLSGVLAGAGDRCGVSGLFRGTLLAAGEAISNRTTTQNQSTRGAFYDHSTCRVSARSVERESRLLLFRLPVRMVRVYDRSSSSSRDT